jgi:hypothetical protein
MRSAMLFLLASFAGTAGAQTPAPAPPPSCVAAEHRQFDFWLGQWTVQGAGGKHAGDSHVESILDGCVLLENWHGASGSTGKSFNSYNRQTGQWEQYWVDNQGTRLFLRGALTGKSMVLAGAQDRPNAQTGKTQRERITWTPNDDGSVRQLWETSVDDGQTWAVSFDGLYTRAAAAE